MALVTDKEKIAALITTAQRHNDAMRGITEKLISLQDQINNLTRKLYEAGCLKEKK